MRWPITCSGHMLLPGWQSMLHDRMATAPDHSPAQICSARHGAFCTIHGVESSLFKHIVQLPADRWVVDVSQGVSAARPLHVAATSGSGFGTGSKSCTRALSLSNRGIGFPEGFRPVGKGC